MENNKKSVNCPVGLSLFATLCILLGVLGIISLALSPFLISITQITVSKSNYLYFLIKGIFSLLYFISGIGYLKVKWYQGYVLGNITAIAGLLSIAFSVILKGPESLNVINKILLKLVFPIITLLLLNLRYRKVFLDARSKKPEK